MPRSTSACYGGWPRRSIGSREACTATPFPFTDFGGNFEAQAVALEPTVALDQLSNYLQHLNELRRINEGDDTADSPGYSLRREGEASRGFQSERATGFADEVWPA
ncbi:MAG TPA: hypothetical protein VMV69_25045 [Pirellulales bacterium]|nr:hypothetical protein [Pirellulales bacterium]